MPEYEPSFDHDTHHEPSTRTTPPPITSPPPAVSLSLAPAIIRSRSRSSARSVTFSARDNADIHQQHVDTVRILDARLTLFEHHVNRVERNMNYLARKLKNWARHKAEETPEDEFLRLWTAVVHIASRIGDIDRKVSGMMNQTWIKQCEMLLVSDCFLGRHPSP